MQTRTGTVRKPLTLGNSPNSEIHELFFIFFRETYKTSFRGWLITATRNHAAISQKEAIESPEMERFWFIKFRKFNALPLIEYLDVFQLHLLRQLLSGFEDNVVVSRMARKLNLQAVSSLGAVQFSENLGCIILLFSTAKLTKPPFQGSQLQHREVTRQSLKRRITGNSN